jgi:hydrogenase-4 component E
MGSLLDPLLIVLLALNFFVLGVSRVRAVINAVAFQGALFGLLPLLVHQEGIGVSAYVLVVAAVGLKGYLIPTLLLRAMREANIQREVEPLVGFLPSLLLGAVGTALALVFARTLPLVTEHAGLLLVPTSLATVLTGFLVLTTRRKAIVQVVGYLLLENGVFAFGMLLLEAMPFLVELGVLLDLFTGVFVMGIIIHHINREFASDGMEQLAELKRLSEKGDSPLA